MTRVRLSTTVDEALLTDARRIRGGGTDASMVEEALRALLTRHRAAEIDAAEIDAAEIDASYGACDRHPLDEPDVWGDLNSFRDAAGASRHRPRAEVCRPMA